MNFSDFYNVLLESNPAKRIEYLRSKYGNALNDLLNKYLVNLPTNAEDWFLNMYRMDFPQYVVNRIDPQSGVYSEWIIKNLLKENFNSSTFDRFISEDFYKVYEDLQKYHKYKKLFKNLGEDLNNPNTIKLGDINQIKSFTDLYEKLRLLEPYIEKEEEKAELKAAEKDAEKIYNSDNYLIIIPKTREASCAYGRNTRWCTASTGSYNYFDQYNSKGPLYIIINKKTNQKHQFHFATAQYMDEDDDPVEIGVFVYNNPEIKNILIDLALKNENLDFVKEILPFSEIVEKIETVDESTKIKMIRDNFVVAYRLGLKDPELVNNNQKLIRFNSDESINLNTGIKGFLNLTDYLMDEDDAYRSQRIYDREYVYDIYRNVDDLEYYDWDWINEKNFDEVKKYCRNLYPSSFKQLGDYDSLTKDEVKEFLKDKDDSHVNEQINDSYKKVYIDTVYDILKSEIDEKIFKKLSREYSYNSDHYLIFKMNSSKMEKIVKDFEKNPDEIPATTNYGNFMRSYHSVLEIEGDLVSPNFNADTDLSVDDPDQYKMFNEYFSEDFSIGQDVYNKDQLQFDFSGVNRIMNKFDGYIYEILKELNMAGPLTNQSGQTNTPQNVTTPNKPTTSTQPNSNSSKPNISNKGKVQVSVDLDSVLNDQKMKGQWGNWLKDPNNANALKTQYTSFMFDTKADPVKKDQFLKTINSDQELSKFVSSLGNNA